jgi:hypothetical protein
MVVVHFYMGNDGPGLVLERQESRGILDRSYARTFLVSSLKVLTSWNRPRVAASAGTAAPPMGGERVSEQPDITDSEFEPAFSEQTFGAIAADELGRLYRDNNWSETLAELDALRTEVVARTGHKPIIMLYPSALQVYPERFETTRRAVAKRLQTLGLKPDDFSQTSPNRILLDYCWRSGLSCFDLTPAMTKAGSESADPLYRPRETHWNIRGNRVAAAAEGEFLRQKICEAAGL